MSSSSSSSSSSWSSSSSSSTSQSSSSSSSSGAAGRKIASDWIKDPIDILEHIKRLQNYSDQETTAVDWGKAYAPNALIDTSTDEGGFDYELLYALREIRPFYQVLNYRETSTEKMAEKVCKGFFLASFQDPATGEERVTHFAQKAASTPATTITLSDIIGPIKPVTLPQERDIYPEAYIRYCRHCGSGEYLGLIKVTQAAAAAYDSSYVTGVSGDVAEMLWTKAHVLWEATRRVEIPPSDMTDHDLIVRPEDALWYLDTWFGWMGAVDTDGTPSGIVYQPRKRIAFTVNYELGKDWFLTQHHLLQLPHQTTDIALEFAIEGYKKQLAAGKEAVEISAVLYGDETEIALYVQDTPDAGTILDDWQDNVDLQAVHGEGPDTQDIT